MVALWSVGVYVGARGQDAGSPIPSCLGMRVRGLVI